MPLTEAEELELLELEEQEYQESLKQKAPEVSGLESGLRGAAQGASLGFADEITGAVESLFTDKPYEQARDESRRAFDAAQQANPGLYMGGQIGGGIATALIPGVGLAKGAGLLANSARAAALGGVAGIGASEADDFTADAVMGAGLGAVGGAAGYGLGKAIEKGASMLSSAAPKVADKLDEVTERAGRDLLSPTVKESLEMQPGTGKMLFDDGYAGFFKGPKEVATNLTKKIDSLESANNAIVAGVDDAGQLAQRSPTLRSMYDRVQALRESGKYYQADALEDLYKGLLNRAEFKNRPGIRIGVLENIKGEAQNIFDKSASGAKTAAGKEYAHLLRKGVESELGEIAPDVAPAYAANNATIHRLINPRDMALKSAEKEARQGLSRFGKLDQLPKEVYKTVMAPERVGAVSNQLSKLVKQAPQAFGRFADTLQQAAQRGGNSLAATNYLLMQKEPEYRELMRKMDGGDGQ